MEETALLRREVAVLSLMIAAMSSALTAEQRMTAFGHVSRGFAAPPAELDALPAFELQVRRMSDLLFGPRASD